jgi:hypothetical protein
VIDTQNISSSMDANTSVEQARTSHWLIEALQSQHIVLVLSQRSSKVREWRLHVSELSSLPTTCSDSQPGSLLELTQVFRTPMCMP